MTKFALLLLPCIAFSGPLQALELLKKTKEIAGTAADIVETTVTNTADTVGKVATGKKDDPVQARAGIDQMAANALAKLTGQSPALREQMDKSHGYAVFDSRVSSFGITTGHGKGVAVRLGDNRRTYMRMATGGVNLGMGIQYFQVIFLFPDAKTFDYFVDVGWDAGADATGAAGKDTGSGESLGMTLANGVRVYQLNDKGIMLKLSLTGTKYWQWDHLNQGK